MQKNLLNNAVINSIRAGLKQYANDKLYSEGLEQSGQIIHLMHYLKNLLVMTLGDRMEMNPEVGQLDGIADSDGEWTFDFNSSGITHSTC